MGRKFKNNRRKKPLTGSTNSVYLKNPVGSNEWHREQRVRMQKMHLAEAEALKRKKLRKSL
jgi:hypothetical protein